jgi:RNA polymerase sigma factor (TIGR02999 family)
MSEVIEALERIGGHDSAEFDHLFAAYYPELKKIAHARLRGTQLQGFLQTTALVHESYLKLSGASGRAFPDRLHFLAYASRTLRSIVIDIVREERAQRRGGGLDLITLDTASVEGLAPSVDVETVNRALEGLRKLDEPLARLVEMRFFGGLTEVELAEALGTSERTVRREWQKARALLLTLIEP